jgi:chemotaxis protein CheD
MKTPPHTLEIFLQPGEWYFGERDTRIRTVLGSCVSLTCWHPRLRIGGMCHYMLPARGAGGAPAATLDGRYADEALLLLLGAMRAAGTGPGEYEFKLFGGGHMFPGLNCLHSPSNVPSKNIAAARALAARHNLVVAAEHMGGAGHRHVIFDVWSGHVWVRHHAGSALCQCQQCEARVECVAG